MRRFKQQFYQGRHRFNQNDTDSSSESQRRKEFDARYQDSKEVQYQSTKQHVREILRNPFHLDRNHQRMMLQMDTYNSFFGSVPQKYPSTQPIYEQQNYKGRRQQLERAQRGYQRRLMTQQRIGSDLHKYRTIPSSNNLSQNQYLFPVYDYDQYSSNKNLQFPNPFIRYKIIPVSKLKMSLDITTIDSKDYKSGHAIIYKYHGGANQQFYLKKLSNNPRQNRFYIINASNGFSLEMSETYYENGNIPVISTPHENKRSKIWTLVPLDLKKSEFKIVSAINNRVLDVQNMWMANGNPVILFQDNDGSNQKWKIWPI